MATVYSDAQIMKTTAFLKKTVCFYMFLTVISQWPANSWDNNLGGNSESNGVTFEVYMLAVSKLTSSFQHCSGVTTAILDKLLAL